MVDYARRREKRVSIVRMETPLHVDYAQRTSRASTSAFDRNDLDPRSAPLNAAAASEAVARRPTTGPFDAARARRRTERRLLDERRRRRLAQVVCVEHHSRLGRTSGAHKYAARRAQQRGLQMQSHLATSPSVIPAQRRSFRSRDASGKNYTASVAGVNSQPSHAAVTTSQGVENIGSWLPGGFQSQRRGRI